MRIQKVGQVGVPVKDLDRAICFYRDILGLDLLFQAGNLAFFDCNGLRLLLSPPEKDEFAHSSSIIYYQVEHIHETYEELKKKGVSFIDEPHFIAKVGETETWMAFFQDQEGNTHALMSELSS
ncbi:VOC family protein [Bacillus sp. S/N-304-OC-R1]|uniref:VOC family protein n=1 Tax=Bacillus sp. S/N-304-OC-R1 TaxID=2758034 RepID=UPI001C8D9547|nr:VOC family protein [Bacillus sp. S/N-304-OC-R1]MBY0123370.1 VOC family protein [Bacillus sp. S/N-304-OC-R1]